jgi:hypothetical protein
MGSCSLERSGGGQHGASSDGESIGREDQEELLGVKHEDLAEDLSFSASHPLDPNRFDQ